MENAITYILKKYRSTAITSCKVFYDFNEENNDNIVYNTTGVESLSGYITGYNTQNFYQYSGVGNFSGNSVYIDNKSGYISTNNCTYFITYNNNNTGNFVLVNCIETGEYGNNLYYKGYEFGVTSNNRLYFTYYDNNGAQVAVGNEYLADKSNVYLSLGNNNVSFGNYDFASQSLNITSKIIKSEYIFNSSGIWLSSNLNNSLYSANSAFDGTMNRALIFSPSVSISDLRLINSGSVCQYSGQGESTVYTSGYQITGYSSQMVPYFTGITGSEFGPTGVIVDIWGDRYSGYGTVYLTGVLYSEIESPMFGWLVTGNTVYNDSDLEIDYNLVNSYGKSIINYLHNIQNNDILNYVYSTGIYRSLDQRGVNIDYAKGYDYFRKITNRSGEYDIWANGVYQQSGKIISNNDIYNPIETISGDYVIKNNRDIFFSNTFGINDNIIMDIIYDNESQLYHYNLYIDNFNLQNGNLVLDGDKYNLNWPPNSQIFLNGQKLISGNESQIGNNADYGVSSSGIFFKNTGVFYNISNSNLSAIVEQDMLESTGIANLKKFEYLFPSESVKIYRNGIRADRGLDYIEMGSYNMKLNTGIFDKKNYIIYNINNDLLS